MEFRITPQEKLEMLVRFCRFYNVILCNTPREKEVSFECSNNGPLRLCQKSLQIIINLDTTGGFPFLCEEFFSDRKSLKKGSSFFHAHSARSYVKGQVDELLSEEKYLGYAILVFFLLRDKSLKVDSLEELLKYKTEIIKFEGMVGDISPQKITKASVKGSLKDMLDIFIIQCERGYRLKHMVIFEAVLLSFGENFPEEFLELVSKSVLLTYVRSKGYVPERHEVIIQFDENLTESLAKKLIEVYGSNKEEAFSDIYSHPSFHDRRLVDCFFLDILEREESFKVFLNSFLAFKTICIYI